jgi:hypothetical protein
VTFFGLNTFIELYWVRDLHASRGLAGIALLANSHGPRGALLALLVVPPLSPSSSRTDPEFPSPAG